LYHSGLSPVPDIVKSLQRCTINGVSRAGKKQVEGFERPVAQNAMQNKTDKDFIALVLLFVFVVIRQRCS